MAAGKMTGAAAAVVNKIQLRDPALANKIRQDLATGDRQAFITDTDQAATFKRYITPREWQTLLNGTTWDGKATAGSAFNAGPKAGAKAAEAAVPSITGFLSALVNPHTWLRVAEVGIGVLLVAVGVAKLTNAIPIATKLAGTVGKMPIPV
jgi:hypothetical protein